MLYFVLCGIYCEVVVDMTYSDDSWLEEMALDSAKELLSVNEVYLNPVGRMLLPIARKVVAENA